MRIPLRRLIPGLVLFALAAPASVAHAGGDDAGGSDAPKTDEELADDFQQELEELLADAGHDGELPEIIGEAGDLDLPPGELVYLGAIEATSAEDTPSGDGSELSGPCMGITMSFGSDGELIDMAADFDEGSPPVDLIDGGQAFTADNPYEVDVDGYVAYAGSAEPAPINHTWAIRVQGLSLDSGGDDNEDEEDRNAGTVNLADDLPAPAKVNALIAIDGEMNADGGFNCTGSGFIKTVGGYPILGGLGLILLLCGGLGALFNARPAKTWKG
jgi:hypothetical protein